MYLIKEKYDFEARDMSCDNKDLHIVIASVKVWRLTT